MQKGERQNWATLRETLELHTADDLKRLLPLLVSGRMPTRKSDLVEAIASRLQGDSLRQLWDRLDDLQQKAVSETIYSTGGVFNLDRFVAKYGEPPNFGKKKDRWSYREDPSLLQLFVYRDSRYGERPLVVPEDLKERLLPFVPPPPATRLVVAADLPEYYERVDREYLFDEEEEDQGLTVISRRRIYHFRKPKGVEEKVRQIPLVQRETEQGALQDLSTLLRLIDKGKVSVSDKTHQPSAATIREIAALLRDGDFYELRPKREEWEQEIGPIKAFAWPLLVQGAKLAELEGKKLSLTKAGREALNAPPAATLKLIWERWLKTKLLDEFNRIDVIKGQHGKGKHGLTAAEIRRAVINRALAHCPVGEWVKFDDFSRYMVAAGCGFVVTYSPWDLYIADAHYGSLGHQGGHNWNVLQGRYLRCLLFEYAATLGMVDVAYVDPGEVAHDFDLWGTDDLEFLSRYDGLLYFRLNPLGAYCLGLTEKYQPSRVEAHAALAVLPSLEVRVAKGALAPDEALLLETWAEREGEGRWRLDGEKALSAIESGHRIEELRDFLQARDEQPLPETVEGFIARMEKNARALRNAGAAVLIECADAQIAEEVAANERAKRLCRRSGDRHLVIAASKEEEFRRALHVLGYGMPRV